MPRIKKPKFTSTEDYLPVIGDVIRILPKPEGTEFECGGDHFESFYTTTWTIKDYSGHNTFYCIPDNADSILQTYLGEEIAEGKIGWHLDKSEFEVYRPV